VFHVFEQVPAGIGKEALKALDRRQSRRRSLQLLGALLVAAPAGWLAWRQMPDRSVEVATATGERKTLALPDGSRLVCNTASDVDIAFSSTERRIRLLAGEILITTHPDSGPTYRPFLVDTPHGVVRALGTLFSVRRLDGDACRVAVFEHAVELHPLAGVPRILHAGQQADFGLAHISQPVPVDGSAALWEQGMLLAKNMRLGDVIAELARQRPGVLQCDPAVADLRVSGAISLDDTDAGLELLAGTLPVRIERRTRYWVTVRPRS
jgi:transmembrane sensor